MVDWDQYDRRLGEGAGASGASSGSGGSGGTTTGGGGGGGTAAPWFDESYTRRRQLGFASQPESLTEFPVLVLLDATRITYGLLQPQGEDLRFVAADSITVLSHEVETWDPSGVSIVWVKVPVIASSSSSEHVWMYYANPTASDAQNAADTWSAGYGAVWHMTPGLSDSTAHGNHGTNGGTSGGEGVIGPARSFNGVSTYVDVGSDPSIDNLFATGGTVSAWIRPLTWGGNSLGRILDKSTSTGTAGGWSLLVDGAAGVPNELASFVRRVEMGNHGWDTAGQTIVLDPWQWVTVVFDESNPDNAPTLYIDGAAQALSESAIASGSAVNDDLAPMRIGNFGAGITRGFDGIIDEVRVSPVPRTAAWIAAQYASMTDTLIGYGPEETFP